MILLICYIIIWLLFGWTAYLIGKKRDFKLFIVLLIGGVISMEVVLITLLFDWLKKKNIIK